MSDPNDTPTTPADAPERAPAPTPEAPPPEATQTPPDVPPSPPRRPVEAWARDRATPAWVFAAAKTMHRWPDGVELSETDYGAACDAAQNEVIR